MRYMDYLGKTYFLRSKIIATLEGKHKKQEEEMERTQCQLLNKVMLHLL